MERPPRQRSPSQIGLHHADQRFGGEPPPKPGSQRSVELNRDDPGPGTGERRGERAVPGAQVEDQVTVADAAARDQLPVNEEVRAWRVRRALRTRSSGRVPLRPLGPLKM